MEDGASLDAPKRKCAKYGINCLIFLENKFQRQTMYVQHYQAADFHFIRFPLFSFAFKRFIARDGGSHLSDCPCA
jgi:hypothetical protein